MSLSPGGTPNTSLPPAAMDPRVPVILRMRRGAGMVFHHRTSLWREFCPADF